MGTLATTRDLPPTLINLGGNLPQNLYRDAGIPNADLLLIKQEATHAVLYPYRSNSVPLPDISRDTDVDASVIEKIVGLQTRDIDLATINKVMGYFGLTLKIGHRLLDFSAMSPDIDAGQALKWPSRDPDLALAAAIDEAKSLLDQIASADELQTLEALDRHLTSMGRRLQIAYHVQPKSRPAIA